MPTRGNYRRRYKTSKKGTVSVPVKRYVSKQIHKNIENKFLNNGLPVAFSSIGNSWVESDLTNIGTGSTVGNRNGNEIKLKSFFMNGTLAGGQNNLATDDNRNTVRMVLALWDSTSATPLATNAATIDSYITAETSAGKGLIKKIMDTVIELPSPGRDSTGYMPSLRRIQKFKKLYSTIKYYGATSTVSNKKLILSMISDSSLVSHPGFTQGHYTWHFEDA